MKLVSKSKLIGEESSKSQYPLEFLNVKELSKWIRLSESHLYCLVNKNKIPYLKLGGKLLFETKIIRGWIDLHSRNYPN